MSDLLKSLDFQERYSDMEGAEGGYSGKERRKLKKAEKAGVTLSGSQEDRQDYLETINQERIGAAANLGAAAIGTVAGLYTGNMGLVTSSIGLGADYLGGEMAEYQGGEGVSEKLNLEDAAKIASPFLTTMGQGTREKGGGDTKDIEPKIDAVEIPEVIPKDSSSASGKLGMMGDDGAVPSGATSPGKGTGHNVTNLLQALQVAPIASGKQGTKLRYNPRKYDYIKGNSFGF